MCFSISLAVIFFVFILWIFRQNVQGFGSYLCAGLLTFTRTSRENSTQTEELTGKESQGHTDELLKSCVEQPVKPHQVGVDEVDRLAQEAHRPSVKRSFQRVFDCAYRQYFQPWYDVPEPMKSQPLYGALWREVEPAVDQIVETVLALDVSTACVGCVRIVTRHLHDAKQNRRGPLFNSREKEMAFLRLCSEALVQNLLPETTWRLDLNQCALKEAVAVNGLSQSLCARRPRPHPCLSVRPFANSFSDVCHIIHFVLAVVNLLVSWISDPDTLNQLLVSTLDTVSPRGRGDMQEEQEMETGPSPEQREQANIIIGGTGDAEDPRKDNTKTKKKGRRKKLFDIFRKMNPKKSRKRKQEEDEEWPLYRSLVFGSQEALWKDDVSSGGSMSSLSDCLTGDSDAQSCLSCPRGIVELQLSYEVWQFCHWTATVKQVEQQNEELLFTIHLAEEDNAGSLHWDITKSHTDIRQFVSKLSDVDSLRLVTPVLESKGQTMDDAFQEKARSTLESFLQALLSDRTEGCSQDVFEFLCPLQDDKEASGGLWGFLSDLAWFLVPNQEEGQKEENEGQMNRDDLPPQCTECQSEGGDGGVGDGEVHSGSFTQSDTPHEHEDTENNCEESTRDTPISEPSEDGLGVNEANASEFQFRILDPRTSSPGCNQDLSSEDSVKEPAEVGAGAFPNLQENKTNEGISLLSKISVGVRGKQVKGQSRQSEPKDTETCSRVLEAITDLLKEICGTSIFFIIVKPFKRLLINKVSAFLTTMSVTEDRLACLVDSLRETQWPGGVPAGPVQPRSSAKKSESMESACRLLTDRCSNIILNKSNVEATFKVFQDTERNKKLVYKLLLFLLKELFPGHVDLHSQAESLLSAQ